MGWQNVFSCEKDPFCRTVLKHYWPNTTHYEDIYDFRATHYRGHIDIITGGFPCQPFSQAGRRKGAKDNRYLFPETIRIIKEARPEWIVLENVTGLFTILEPDSLSEMEIKAIELFVRTVNNLQQAPSSDSNDELSEASFQKSEQQDMYFRHLKTARQSFCVFRLLPLALHTNGIGFGLLPTPTATEISNIKTTIEQAEDRRRLKDRKNERGNGGQVSLTDFLVYHALISLWSPAEDLAERMPQEIQKRLLKVLPTAEQIDGTKFPYGRDGQLNPRFVAEMMGFPKDWTELPFRHGVPKA